MMHVYTSDYNDVLPLVSERLPLAGSPAVVSPETLGLGYNWMGLLRNHSNVGTGVFHCASDEDVLSDDRSFWGGGFPDDTSYNANGVRGYADQRMPWSVPPNPTYIGDKAGPLRLSQIPQGSRMLQAYDGGVYMFSIGSLTSLKVTYNNYISLGPTSSRNMDSFRHTRILQRNTPDGPNGLMADGHAEASMDLFSLEEEDVVIPF